MGSDIAGNSSSINATLRKDSEPFFDGSMLLAAIASKARRHQIVGIVRAAELTSQQVVQGEPLLAAAVEARKPITGIDCQPLLGSQPLASVRVAHGPKYTHAGSKVNT